MKPRVLTHQPYCVFVKRNNRRDAWELVARCKDLLGAYELRDYYRSGCFDVEVKLEVGGRFA